MRLLGSRPLAAERVLASTLTILLATNCAARLPTLESPAMDGWSMRIAIEPSARRLDGFWTVVSNNTDRLRFVCLQDISVVGSNFGAGGGIGIHTCQDARVFTKVPPRSEAILSKQGHRSVREVADNELFSVDVIFLPNDTEDLSGARTRGLRWDGRMGNAKRNWVELKKPPN